jgi:hypothetical protein
VSICEGPNLSLNHVLQILSGCWWLTLVILATQEAKIKRIAVRSQPGQIIHETLHLKNT